MNKRVIAIVTGVVALLTICWLVNHNTRRPQDDKKASVPAVRATTEPQSLQSVTSKPADEAKTTDEPDTLSHYEMVQTNVAVDPDVEAKSKGAEPFRLIGYGSADAKIVDRAGNVVFQADSEMGIFGCDVSPDGRRIAVSFAGKGSIILDPASGAKVQLPLTPPGQNKFVFSSYYWINNDTLVAESGDQKVDANGRPVRSDANVAQTRLYLYDISQQQLREVQLPKDLGAKVFSIAFVSSKGYVHLVTDDPNATRAPDLGWFEVHSK